MKNAGHTAQLGMPTLVAVFVHIARVWRVMQPETGDRALYDVLFRDTCGLVYGGVVSIVESVFPIVKAKRVRLSPLGQGERGIDS